MGWRLGLLAVLALVFLGCGPVVNYSPLISDPQVAKPLDSPIAVYLTTAPECKYQELGIVRASEGAFDGGMETFIEAMKVKARAVGGDAIILGKLESSTAGYVAVSPGILAAAEEQAQAGVIIRFIDVNCQK